jgi:hypothetical protein
VPTAPSAHSVVIHAEPSEAPPDVSAPAPVVAAPPPVAAPPAIVVPVIAPAPAPAGAPPATVSVAPVLPLPPGRQPATRQSVPAVAVDAPAPPLAFRAGYTEVLRDADLQALIFATVPGVAGMLAFTAAGGLVGYRQAKAARAMRSTAIARFMQ